MSIFRGLFAYSIHPTKTTSVNNTWTTSWSVPIVVPVTSTWSTDSVESVQTSTGSSWATQWNTDDVAITTSIVNNSADTVMTGNPPPRQTFLYTSFITADHRMTNVGNQRRLTEINRWTTTAAYKEWSTEVEPGTPIVTFLATTFDTALIVETYIGGGQRRLTEKSRWQTTAKYTEWTAPHPTFVSSYVTASYIYTSFNNMQILTETGRWQTDMPTWETVINPGTSFSQYNTTIGRHYTSITTNSVPWYTDYPVTFNTTVISNVNTSFTTSQQTSATTNIQTLV